MIGRSFNLMSKKMPSFYFYSQIFSQYRKKNIYDKKWIEMALSKSSKDQINVMKVFLSNDNNYEYMRFSNDLNKSISQLKESEVQGFSSIFLISSLLFIKTKEKYFLNLLQAKRKTIEIIISKLDSQINENLSKNPQSFELDHLKNINFYLCFFFAKCLIIGLRPDEIYDYDLFQAFLEISSNLNNEKDDLKNEILLKLIFFYPMISRFSIMEHQKNSFLKKIFIKMELYNLYKSHIINEMKSCENLPKFSLLDSNFLQALFSFTQGTIFFNDFFMFPRFFL